MSNDLIYLLSAIGVRRAIAEGYSGLEAVDRAREIIWDVLDRVDGPAPRSRILH